NVEDEPIGVKIQLMDEEVPAQGRMYVKA
ncbi:hypothetical protein A2U01_0063251, partial [Trifolium medium]|nr:hypothetical protein [Trifolium medium]